MPLNCSAFPYLPEAVHVAFVILPVLPFPEASVTVVPDPSSNPYAATSPVAAEVEAAADTISATPIATAIATATQVRLMGVARPARSPCRPLRSALISRGPFVGAHHLCTNCRLVVGTSQDLTRPGPDTKRWESKG